MNLSGVTISSAEQHQLAEERKKREEDERREEERKKTEEKERAKAAAKKVEEERRRGKEEEKAKAAADKSGEDRKGSFLMTFSTLAAIIAAVRFMTKPRTAAAKEGAAANKEKEEAAAKELDSPGKNLAENEAESPGTSPCKPQDLYSVRRSSDRPKTKPKRLKPSMHGQTHDECS